MSNWNKPAVTMHSPDAAIRWWMQEHFAPASQWEVGVGAIFLFASYCDAAAVTGLPIVSGSLFGRVMGGLVPRRRNSSGSNLGATTYQLRPLSFVKLTEVPFESGMRGGGLMKKIYVDACKRTGVAVERTWDEFAADRRLDEKIVARHIVDKHALRPTLAPGRKAVGIEEPLDEGRLTQVPVKELWDDFQDIGWSYIKFLGVLGQVTAVSRAARCKVAYLENP